MEPFHERPSIFLPRSQGWLAAVVWSNRTPCPANVEFGLRGGIVNVPPPPFLLLCGRLKAPEAFRLHLTKAGERFGQTPIGPDT